MNYRVFPNLDRAREPSEIPRRRTSGEAAAFTLLCAHLDDPFDHPADILGLAWGSDARDATEARADAKRSFDVAAKQGDARADEALRRINAAHEKLTDPLDELWCRGIEAADQPVLVDPFPAEDAGRNMLIFLICEWLGANRAALDRLHAHDPAPQSLDSLEAEPADAAAERS